MRTFSFFHSRLRVRTTDRRAINTKEIKSFLAKKFSYLLGEFVGRVDADDNLLGLLGGRFDRNQVGGER
jgi:hypothetical protein